MTTTYKQFIFQSAITMISSAMGVFLYQFFLERSEIIAQRTELKKEIVIQQLTYLQKMRTLTEIAREEAPIPGKFTKPINQFLSTTDKIVPQDSLVLIHFTPYPSIIKDSLIQNRFWNLVTEIENGREKIDPEAFSNFVELSQYLKENSFYEDWDEKKRSAWVDLNKKLNNRINQILSLSD